VEDIERVLSIGGVAILAVIGAAITLIVPLHAYRRGHGLMSWFALQFVAFNPIYPLILVAILPHKARMRLRTEYERDLDERLRRAGAVRGSPRAAELPADPNSIGDRSTAGSYGASIGDLPTRP
jgi:hypothetical protein